MGIFSKLFQQKEGESSAEGHPSDAADGEDSPLGEEFEGLPTGDYTDPGVEQYLQTAAGNDGVPLLAQSGDTEVARVAEEEPPSPDAVTRAGVSVVELAELPPRSEQTEPRFDVTAPPFEGLYLDRNRPALKSRLESQSSSGGERQPAKQPVPKSSSSPARLSVQRAQGRRATGPAPGSASRTAPPPVPVPVWRQAEAPKTERDPAAHPGNMMTAAVVGNHAATRPAVPRSAADDSTGAILEAAFHELANGGSSEATTDLTADASSQREVQQLFAEMAARHVTLVRDFMFELTLIPIAPKWAENCRSAIESLERGAEGMQREELVGALQNFAVLLRRIATSNAALIEGDRRTAVLSAYEQLQELLPEAFAAEPDRERRDAIIVDALLGQIPADAITRQRLQGAGWYSLETLYRASASELASVTGIELEAAEAITDRFTAYREQRVSEPPDPMRGRERQELDHLLGELLARHQAFCRAEEEEDKLQKRAIRRERGLLLRRIEVLLAQLGELTLVEELQRLPITRKIARVKRLARYMGQHASG